MLRYGLAFDIKIRKACHPSKYGSRAGLVKELTQNNKNRKSLVSLITYPKPLATITLSVPVTIIALIFLLKVLLIS